MKKTVLVPLPKNDCDPSEVAVPWKILSQNGVRVVFSTPDAQPASCDDLMLTGKGLGPAASMLIADKNAQSSYAELEKSEEFNRPILWSTINEADYDALLLPGGHAKGMREYLESSLIQEKVKNFFQKDKPVAAICHGVLLAARTQNADGKSVLYQKNVTCVLQTQELLAWNLTRIWQGDYYRTYDVTTQKEVTSYLKDKNQFIAGPMPLRRDSPTDLKPGFSVKDGNFLSARWPGDVHSFSYEFLDMIKSTVS